MIYGNVISLYMYIFTECGIIDFEVVVSYIYMQNLHAFSFQPREDTPLEAILPDEYPIVKRPSPLAIQIIEKFLYQKKIRLLDLFQAVDKQKKWKVTRDEFRKTIQEVIH